MSVGMLALRALGLVAVAAVVCGGAVVVGLDALHAVGLGCVVLAALLLAAVPAQTAVRDWADGVDRPLGGRGDVDELAWSLLERDGRLRGRVLDRLRRVLPADDGAALRPLLDTDRRRPAAPGELDRALTSREAASPSTTDPAAGTDRSSR